MILSGIGDVLLCVFDDRSLWRRDVTMTLQRTEAIEQNLRTMNIFDTDPDYRKSPKTEVFCVRCNRDLKPSQQMRWIHMISEEMLIHPEDLQKVSIGDGWPIAYPVGMDCAKIIGLEWTTEAS